MPIGTAYQDGNNVFIRDEQGRAIATISAWDGLQGYTSTTVSVRSGNNIFIYDEKGRVISQVIGCFSTGR